VTFPSNVPRNLVVDFDIYDHSMADHFHEVVDELRRTTPVAWTDRNEGHWIVTRYEDVQRVLRDSDDFSSNPVAVARSREADERNRPIPVCYDPPEHTSYRDMIAPLFSPRRMRDLEEPIRKLVRELIGSFKDKGRCEFITEFARPLPTTVFLLMMGWPLDRAAEFNHWSHQILTGKPGGTIEESAAVRAEYFAKTYDYFDSLVQARRANPQDDFTTELVNGLYAGDRPLTDDELQRMLQLLMSGGLHTVQGSLAYAAIRFAGQPEEQARLAADKSLVPYAVEELLRWEPPVWPGRRATRDVVIGGVEIKAEDMVLCGVTGANRDESEFDDADRLDLDRRANRHLAFGVGRHRCIGSHLARIELCIAVEELHKQLPTYRLDPARPPVRHLGTVNGVSELHLVF
jgi:cytochrome P450